MRRKEKEITDKSAIENILKDAEIIRIAMVDDGEPYLVAMNYAYSDGFIYMHSALEGRKIDILRKNNRVAFQTETNAGLVLKDKACDCGAHFLSVFGTGRAYITVDLEEKTKALDAIMVKYTGRAGRQYPEGVMAKTLAIRVEIDSMTGKKSGQAG